MDLIYNQKDIPRDQWRYGFRSSAATGCGWIATYNALGLLGRRTNIDELIRYYEWQLPLIHGNAGTSFWGPALCFRRWGFPVEVCAKPGKFDDVVNSPRRTKKHLSIEAYTHPVPNSFCLHHPRRWLELYYPPI